MGKNVLPAGNRTDFQQLHSRKEKTCRSSDRQV